MASGRECRSSSGWAGGAWQRSRGGLLPTMLRLEQRRMPAQVERHSVRCFKTYRSGIRSNDSSAGTDFRPPRSAIISTGQDPLICPHTRNAAGPGGLASDPDPPASRAFLAAKNRKGSRGRQVFRQVKRRTQAGACPMKSGQRRPVIIASVSRACMRLIACPSVESLREKI
jgi:hypothetical protein